MIAWGKAIERERCRTEFRSMLGFLVWYAAMRRAGWLRYGREW